MKGGSIICPNTLLLWRDQELLIYPEPIIRCSLSRLRRCKSSTTLISIEFYFLVIPDALLVPLSLSQRHRVPFRKKKTRTSPSRKWVRVCRFAISSRENALSSSHLLLFPHDIRGLFQTQWKGDVVWNVVVGKRTFLFLVSWQAHLFHTCVCSWV